MEKSKEKLFEEFLHNDLRVQNFGYYNKVYNYLLRFEYEFTNLTLMDFILNCDCAKKKVLDAIINYDVNEFPTINYIIEQREFYETEIISDRLTTNKLNDFELFLTKFVVAYFLVVQYRDDKNRISNYFYRILSITERQNIDFKYFIIYHQIELENAIERYQRFTIKDGLPWSKFVLDEKNTSQMYLNREVNDSIEKYWKLELNTKYPNITQPVQPEKEKDAIDSTLHQQFLIFHYLFIHLNIRRNTIDKTEIARFIQFATQKQLEAKHIKNTKIYKLVDNPFNGYQKEKGTTQTNLQKVRELFENIGLKEIAELVSKDII
ncbi:MAG: hypothetical protein IPQ18_07430 [Saprospiraceae bacterium]|nr:hypothetical protein [Saprospiraceae bacterium]